MSEELKDPNLPAGAIVEKYKDGSALRNDGVKLRAANDNPWYVLATIYGEQEGELLDDIWPINEELAEKNRRAWNRWVYQSLTPEQQVSFGEDYGFDDAEVIALMRVDLAEATRVYKQKTGEEELPEITEILDFSNTYYSKPVSFEEYVFAKSSLFHSAVFGEISDFSSAKFYGRSDFICTTFGKHSTFSSAMFDGISDFRFASFGGNSYFDSVKFRNGSYFSSTFFGGESDFSSATFNKFSTFRSATFRMVTAFTSSKFGGGSDFSSVAFDSGTDFNSVEFGGDSNFCFAKFGGDSDFCEAKFCKGSNYRSATFHGDSAFHSVNFSNDSDFSSTTFRGVSDFSSVAFSGRSDFSTSIFGRISDFSSATFNAKTIFDGAKFKTHVPEFHAASLYDDTTFTLPEDPLDNWPPLDGKGVMPAADQKRAYNRLRLFMNQSQQIDEEQFFHRQEMRCKRALADQWHRPLYTGYEKLSDYGNSVVLPLGWLAGMIVFVALVVGFYLILTGQGNWGTATGWSIANSFPFFGFNRLYFGSDFAGKLPWWLKTLGGIQTAFSFILLFLLGLGLRNRFRLR